MWNVVCFFIEKDQVTTLITIETDILKLFCLFRNLAKTFVKSII